MDRTEIEDILQRSEFFKGLDKDDILRIVDISHVESHESGDFVFQQGDYGEYLYTIVQGQIFLERETNMGARKGNVVISTLGRGRVLGCWSTLLDDAHILMSSAVCQKPTTVIAIKGTDLRKIMVENREIGFNVMERLCFILRDRIQSAYGALEKI